MLFHKSSLIAAALFLLSASACLADSSRFSLGSQFDWVANRGFFVELQNDNLPPGGKAPLSTLKLAAGIADGKQWQFITDVPAWSIGHTYTAILQIDPHKSTLSVDGETVGSQTVAFVPNDSAVAAGLAPDWANAPAAYRVVQTDFEIDDANGKHGGAIPPTSPAASLFGNSNGLTIDGWKYSGRPFTVRMVFRFENAIDPAAYYPLVDRFGQPTFATYPGKVGSDSDLTAVIPAENRHEAGWSATRPYNQFGGMLRAHWRDKATGYYHTTRHNGFWWLIDPTGAPVFYTGVCTDDIPTGNSTPIAGRESMFAWLPSKNSEFSPALSENIWGGEPGIAYVSFDDANLIRKYGPDWKTVAAKADRDRVRAWGFSGLGKWAADWPGMPSIPVLQDSGVPKLVRHPDIFDPAVQKQIMDTLTSQISDRLHNPAIVGWSYGNEYDEVFTTDEIRQILKQPESNPSRKALVDYAVASLYGGDTAKAGQIQAAGDADIEKMRQFYADRYYALIHDDIKKIDPNHLFFGWWLVPYWWQNENDWKLQAAHVDVMGIDYYNNSFHDPGVLRWIRECGKPVLVGEYSFPPTYGGTRGFGHFQSSVSTPRDAGESYRRWIDATASNPGVVGVCWFEMRDEPIVGRGPGHGPGVVYGEHYAFGLLDVADSPKWDLVDRVHDANVGAGDLREKASAK